MALSSGQSELAVIIPTYNRAVPVSTAIESVLAADSSRVEIIVVDDGSTDNTTQVLAGYGDRIRTVLLDRRQGGNHARNVGASASRAPVLAFLDSDDAFHASRPSRLIDFYKANPAVDASLDSFVVKRRGKQRDAIQPEGSFSPAQFTHLVISHAVPLTNSTISVRREAFEAIGGYDETLRRHQDRDFLLRLLKTHQVAFGSSKDVLKTQSPDSISREGPDSVSALAAIVQRHPEFQAREYSDLLHYLAARGILKMMIAGDFAAAYAEITFLRNCPVLPQSLTDCLLRYRAGKKARRNARAAAYSRQQSGLMAERPTGSTI